MRIALAAALVLAGCARRYRVEGLVTAIDPARPSITVSHRAIPGYMPAMVMPFRVARPAELASLAPGARIRFELSRSVAHHLRAAVAGDDFTASVPQSGIAVGALVPDFTLMDQDSKTVRLSAFRGRVVAIDFIYTRCPLPDVCPRLSAAFAYADRQIQSPDLVLLSITIDPEYDTPPILAEYAKRWRADARWRFLTGSLDNVRDVAGRFGLAFWPEENMISHSVVTAVIDRQGRLAARIGGAGYRPQELRDLLAAKLGTTQ